MRGQSVGQSAWGDHRGRAGSGTGNMRVHLGAAPEDARGCVAVAGKSEEVSHHPR